MIFKIILHKAKLKYYALKYKIIIGNVLFVINNLNTFIIDLKNEIIENQIIEKNKIKNHFINFFLSLILKYNSK